MDIVFVQIIALTLGMIFLAAAAGKLRDPRAFIRALGGYRLVPDPLLIPAAVLIMAAEIACLVALLSVTLRFQLIGLAIAALLLTLYGMGMAINLLRGRADIDCGCSGPARRTPISRAMVWRNLALAIVALTPLAWDSAVRVLAPLDYITMTGGVACLLLAYAASNEAIKHIGSGLASSSAIRN